jgi:flavodoxin
MGKALIVCATRTGETQQIGNLIAEGIRMSGQEASVVSHKDIKNEDNLKDHDAYVFGSATYHGDMLPVWKARSAVLSALLAGVVRRRAAYTGQWKTFSKWTWSKNL